MPRSRWRASARPTGSLGALLRKAVSGEAGSSQGPLVRDQAFHLEAGLCQQASPTNPAGKKQDARGNNTSFGAGQA